MSRWSAWPSYERAAKQPAPEHGVKVKQIGATWWGQRWLAALERMAGYQSRLERGRTYARAGRVHDLHVTRGVVIAKVTGTRDPYDIRIVVTPLRDEVWRGAIAAMAARAQFAAALLGGEMPREIDAAFAAAGATLFPSTARDLVTSCSCPDSANPCKHVAATHYVLGEAFDRDPFLLFELRGRPRAAVLDGLRAARTPAPAPAKPKAPRAKRPARRAPADFGGWRAEPPALRGISEPAGAGAALRQLGAPPAWSLREDPAALLGPALVAAAARAREIALGSPSAEDEPPAKPRRAKPRKR